MMIYEYKIYTLLEENASEVAGHDSFLCWFWLW
jgi:hypothetical protein